MSLKELRLKANLTQLQMAKLIGCSPRTYQRWEAGTIATPKPVLKLAELLMEKWEK